MKLNVLLFSFIAVALFIQCNTITRSKNHHKLLKQSHANHNESVISADNITADAVSVIIIQAQK